MDKKQLKETIDSLWKKTRKEFDKFSKETNIIVKKSEGILKNVTEKNKAQLEKTYLSLQKQKNYYELGQLIAKTPKNNWTRSKKIDALLKEIQGIKKTTKQKKK